MHESSRQLRVSVALCTYNGERFVAEQLRSILNQSLPVGEIIVSDDGSTDGTLERVNEAISTAIDRTAVDRPTVVILKNVEALGVTRNFEKAILACSGDLIVLCDQDDLWHPNRIERAVREFENRPDLLLVFSDANLVDHSGKRLSNSLFEAIEFSSLEQHNVSDGRARDVLLRRNVVTGATVVFRRSLLKAAVPFPESWVHDEWLAIIAAIEGDLAVIAEPLIDYRQHESNEIGAARPTLAVKLARLREPRRERNRRLLARAESLRDRVDGFDGITAAEAAEVAELTRQKAQHELFRSSLPAFRPSRLVPILRAGASGTYRMFGRGRNDMLRDLLQPDR